jgi:hypothetical protein
MGLIENLKPLREREGEEGIVWKRVYTGDVIITRGQG